MLIRGTIAALAMLAASGAEAALIDVQFNEVSYLQYSGAGVLGSAGDYWNLFSAGNDHSIASASNVALDDTAGNATGVTLNISGDARLYGNPTDSCTNANRYSCPHPEWSLAGTSYTTLASGFLFYNETAFDATVTLAGLNPTHQYEVVVYSASDQPRDTGWEVGGQSGTITGQVLYSLVAGENYLDFASVAPDASGNLAISWESIVGEADFNGIQLNDLGPVSSVPAAAPLALMVPAALGLRRRRRTA